MEWSYGIITVKSREKLLVQTAQSLARGGFGDPYINVDGVHHSPRLGNAGNWILLAWELYIRQPYADRYAIFEDDLITSYGLKEYLEAYDMPEDVYLNLFTWEVNQRLALKERTLQGRPHIGKGIWYPSNQFGRGAVGLVFNNKGFRHLLSSEFLLNKPLWVDRTGKRCERKDPDNTATYNVDGMIIQAMRSGGFLEYVHDPSLVQHVGEKSTIGTAMIRAPHFKGEDFNLMDLL